MDKINLIGAFTAATLLILSCLIFIFRLLDQQKVEYWSGMVFMLMALPLIYLLLIANRLDRPTIYFIQLAVMIGFIILELLLDYLFKVDFRNIRWATITYVTFFFAGTGGMIGLAANTGKTWVIISVMLFFIMTALAFIQHAKTGL